MFEYVASGLSFMRVNFKDSHSGEIMNQLNDLWSNLRGKYDHQFSFLYNAHIEKHFGEVFKNAYKGKGIDQIYADSGGLQMITLGLNITPELKQKVYESQAQYSDYAMSFDEIPVSLIGNRAARLDTSNKYFDRQKFEWCARESGRNIKNQIETFIKLKSDAKPMFIAQGGDCETYVKWVELALEEIPSELHEHIGGIAMSAGGIGNGMLEDCKRAFYYTQLPFYGNRKHLHILGVGSVSRMIPTLAFVNSGLYADMHISYDSTTHTSGIQMGRYYGPHNDWINFGRYLSPEYIQINNDIKKNLPKYNVTDEYYAEAMNISVRNYQKKYGDSAPPIIAFNASLVSSIMNFLHHMDIVRKDFMQIQHIMNPKEVSAMDALRSVKTKTDFEWWEREVGKYLPSQAVKDGLPAILPEEF